MRVSVVIPNWNGEKFLPMCIGSLRKSKFKDFEIIVVDNGSTDASRKIIESKFKEVNLITLDRNYGFSVACNAGIKAGKGEYIFLLNNDMEVHPDCLGELVKALDAHPESGSAAVKMMFYDKRNVVYNVGDKLQISGCGGQRGYGEEDVGQYENVEYVQGVTAGAGFYRRRLFFELGFLDEDYFIFLEDVDWNFRAILAGYKAIYVPSAYCYHIGTATVGLYSDMYVYLAFRNEMFNLIKNVPIRLIIKYLPSILKRYIDIVNYFTPRKQGRLLFKGRISNLLKLYKMLLRRIKIQSRRRVSSKVFEKIVVHADFS